jgi:hypothetical protein
MAEEMKEREAVLSVFTSEDVNVLRSAQNCFTAPVADALEGIAKRIARVLEGEREAVPSDSSERELNDLLLDYAKFSYPPYYDKSARASTRAEIHALLKREPVPVASDLSQRIGNYLSNGGLFNPDMMDHDAVRDLLIDCRAALDLLPVASEPVAWERWMRDENGREYEPEVTRIAAAAVVGFVTLYGAGVDDGSAVRTCVRSRPLYARNPAPSEPQQ